MGKSIEKKLGSLVIFRNILKLPTIKCLIELEKTDRTDTDGLVFAYGEFMSSLLLDNKNFSKYMLDAILCDENIYTSYKVTHISDSYYEDLLLRELKIIKEISLYDGSDVRELCSDEDLPVWQTEDIDFEKIYLERMSEIDKKGYGIFTNHRMFVVTDDGGLTPIKNPDDISLHDLVGYERERNQVILNTQSFLLGKPANNVLLYGDAGTGKSSTVKAIVNSMYKEGLRLIEFKKDQLSLIPKVTEHLTNNPLKFIFFIDDLTFRSDDKDFCALKATLEGGVTDRGNNIVIYATSNHRHMIKESESVRADSVNTADMIQETVSLSARFGITVTYLKSDRESFASIVLELARRADIEMPETELIVQAEAFAIRAGGRNPRTAKQFINLLKANG